jgi:DNA-binding beta-propeller fold protein YncE
VSDQVPGGFSAGSLVAGYRLEERIGEGGMATVFRAYDSRLGRYVALKILAPALASDETFRQRFVRESRAAAAVDEPHIIPVFEAGESGGVLFIAMRYVRGGDVRSLIRGSGPLPAARAADIVAQAASALDAAQARGLVHRDVKPANMLLESSGAGADHVYLSDFGLSKGALAATDLTDRGQFLGTLDYASPEQIEARPLDGRCDQYALACSAFEMLYGEPPFRRDQGVSVMYAHLSEAPPLVRSRRPELAAAVDDVLATGMAKRPGNRYGSCGEFAAALRRALAAEGSPPTDAPRAAHRDGAIAMPVTSGPSGETQPLTKDGIQLSPGGAPQPRWRSAAGLAGICAAVLVLAGGGYLLADGGHARGDGGHARGDGESARTATALAPPACTTTTAKKANLHGIDTATTKLGGAPFGVAVTPSGQYSFVTTGNSVVLVRDGPRLAPRVVRSITVHGAGKGIAVTADGRFAIAAAGNGAAVINVAAAERGLPHPVAGFLASPNGSGAVEVLISPDDQFVFVTLQNSAELAVFNLKTALTSGFSQSGFVGYVPLPRQPVGMTTDGTRLYVVSLTGKLAVLNLNEAETDPANSVVTTVRDGCGSARALYSGNGKVIWVTARQSDALLAFSAAKLQTDPAHALVARVQVGETPLGETLIDHGTLILVADSNLNHLASVRSSLAVVSTANALSGKKTALLGYLPVGPVLRQFAVEPGGHVVLVTVQGAGRLEAVNIDGLP